MLVPPCGRAGRATTAIIKTGTGRWTLSGSNTFTGPTAVRQGTLALARPHSLGAGGEVSVADGATLELNFQGELKIRALTLSGVVQPAGVYTAKTAPKYLRGPGQLRN